MTAVFWIKKKKKQKQKNSVKKTWNSLFRDKEAGRE